MALTPRTTLNGLNVGDYVWCKYSAQTSGQLGVFSDIATKTDADVAGKEIPLASSATPEGYFKLIKAGTDFLGRDILAADRNVQNSVAWDSLNSEGVASGSGLPILMSALSVLMTSTTQNVSPIGTASASSVFSGSTTQYQPWNAFDGLVDDNGWVSSNTSPAWLEFNFNVARKIRRYGIASRPTTLNACPKDFKFQAFNTLTSQWVDLDTQVGVASPAAGMYKYFDIPNNNSYNRYRISITANNGNATYHAIGEFRMFEKVGENELTLRLLTGGTVAADKDNEWDNYIVGSTLNGTITAGDNAVWNWLNQYSWASTTIGGSPTVRGIRGYSAAATRSDGNASSYFSASTGFRPVLVIKSPAPNRYLFQDGADIKYYTGSAWNIAGTAPVTDAMFQASGILDLSLINNTALNLLTSATPTLLVQTLLTSTNMRLVAVPNDKLVLASGDLSIINAIGINSAVLVSTEVNRLSKIIVSIDSGVTWKSWQTNTWVTVQPTIADVAINGMTKDILNTLTRTQWNILTGTGNTMTKTIRFGYLLSIAASSDIVSIDNLSINIDMNGTWDSSIHGTDYSYGYPRNDVLQVKLLSNGDFKINY